MTEIVTAARINNLQSRIALLLGNGAGERGYGQILSSSQLSTAQNKVVNANDMNLIFDDLIRARIHQVGQSAVLDNTPAIAKVKSNVSEIGLAESQHISVNPTTGVVTTSANIINNINYSALGGILDYETLVSAIESDKFNTHPLQMVTETKLISSRSNIWNTNLYYEFIVSFTNADHRRHFFNSGGKLFINASLTSPNGNKANYWASLLNSIGTVTFDYQSTFAEGSTDDPAYPNVTTNAGAGNYELTGAYQTVYQRKTIGSSTYNGNYYNIKAKETSPSSIKFLVEFADVSQNGTLDDVIAGNLECKVSHYRANGQATYVDPTTNRSTVFSTVVVPSPSYATSIELSSSATPAAVYAVTTNKTRVANNENFTVTLNTINVPNGTVVPYTITGVTSADISNAPLTGNYTVVNNTASVTFNTLPVLLTNKTFVLTLENLKKSATVEFAKSKTLVTYELVGGGGAGGFGIHDRGENYRGTYAGSGGTSTIAATGIATISAPGNRGGENCGLGRGSLGGVGQSSYYGPGGSAANRRTPGNSAPATSYGAGGSGGGGDKGSLFDSGGCAGAGGSASVRVTGSVLIEYGTVLNITIGAAGISTVGEWKGGRGAAGYCKITYDGKTFEYLTNNTILIS